LGDDDNDDADGGGDDDDDDDDDCDHDEDGGGVDDGWQLSIDDTNRTTSLEQTHDVTGLYRNWRWDTDNGFTCNTAYYPLWFYL